MSSNIIYATVCAKAICRHTNVTYITNPHLEKLRICSCFHDLSYNSILVNQNHEIRDMRNKGGP